MRRTDTPKPILIKFCVVVDILDIVTYTNFGDHRLRDFWVAGGGQISPSPINFHRRPYNTLALSCEYVIRDLISCPPFLSESRLFVCNFRFNLHVDPFQYDPTKDLACMGDKSNLHTV